jgi:hypothetical protein
LLQWVPRPGVRNPCRQGRPKGNYKQRFFAGLFPHSMVIREVAKMFKPPQ